MNCSKLKVLATGTMIGATALLAAPAMSEKLSQDWQTERDAIWDVTERACNGDQQAYDDLYTAAIDAKNAVAQNNIVWLNTQDKCVFAGSNLSAAYDLQLEAAKAGYPIALNNVAHRYMIGKYIPQHTGMAVNYFDRAIHAGYGTAALELAEYYISGEYIERNYVHAVRYLRQARRDKGQGDEYPDPVAIADIARRLDNMTAREAGFPIMEPQEMWDVFGPTASWSYVKGGRTRARVFVRTDPDTGQLYFGLDRITNNPIIHFMRASVQVSGGGEQDLNFGTCGAANCLEPLLFAGDIIGTSVRIPIHPAQRDATLEAMKAGSTITFRYQTTDSAAINKFANYTMSLKGSRKAIEQVERMSAVIANEYNRPTVDYSESDNPVAFDDGVDDSKDRNQLVDYGAALNEVDRSGATNGSIVLSYEDAAIIDRAARSAGGKFSKAPVTCFAKGQGSLHRGIKSALEQQNERHQLVNELVIAEPLGTIVLHYTWGVIPLEHDHGNRVETNYLFIEQRDYYTGKSECDPDNLEYASPEAMLKGYIALGNSRPSRAFNMRESPNWRQRVVRSE